MNEGLRDLIRSTAEDPELRNCLYLVKNGVPFDVALSLESHQATAWAIIFGELDGSEFDWNTMRWKDPER